MKLFSWFGPRPTPRTLQWLRRYDLVEQLDGDPEKLVENVQQIVARHGSAENTYVLAELALLSGKRAEAMRHNSSAFDLYGIAVSNAYVFLLDEQFDLLRNPYDPRFRQACDVYNTALESGMRLAKARGPLTPGTRMTIRTAEQEIDVAIVSRGSWRPEQIERIEFVSDYELQGLKNHYRTFGLGVPLIAVCRPDRSQPTEQFYAPGMSVPATAFLRVLPRDIQQKKWLCTLELHDPLISTDIDVDGHLVPLETDLSTPLAYSLSDPTFQRTDISLRGLINPDRSQSVQGLYMLEPYDPHKIPVLMVHGLWSSLITWMEMFNDLRGNREIRNNYQFWFYLYPTGQPFWITAAQMRQDLRYARYVLDPEHRLPALDQMVLVGHSMGGLVSKLQTLESRDDYWKLVSDRPLEELTASDEVRQQLRQLLFFHPNPSIRRVVTIATPHRGSEFSNGTTQWLARRVIRLPEAFVATTRRLLADNRDLLNDNRLLRINTSIDSLAPDSPMFPLMLRSPRAPWVKYNNIVGMLPDRRVISRVAGNGDGVVSFDSAHLEDANSETIVPEDHVMVHRHPRAVLEMQRILFEHLTDIRTSTIRRLPPVREDVARQHQ